MMDERTAAAAPGRTAPKKKKRLPGSYKSLRIRLRRRLVESPTVMRLLASLLTGWLGLVQRTNPLVIVTPSTEAGELEPGIFALWHGQHLLAPAVYPSRRGLVAMVSRSADAELNAMVLTRFGVEAVRGSGGRDGRRHAYKGGARALIALKRALQTGKNVCMIADIPHGKPRDAGMGVILLARLSGRPIFGVAIATSRRKVLERTWDKTTINLPFGRGAFIVSDPVHVPSDADDAEMERKRQELTAAIDAATTRAYALLDDAR
jgi:lysophospholipid acyltransferase (LPLAT)-like uncharacterized protein